jgi:hypothetical protein
MKNIILGILLLASINLSAQILNVENYRIKTDTTGWAGKVSLNLSLTENTKSLLMIGNNTHLQYKAGSNLYLFLGQYSLLSSGDNNLINKLVAHFRYNHKFTDRFVGEFFLQAQQNSISKIDLRKLIGTGLRFKLSKSEKLRYYLGTSLMYEMEKLTTNVSESDLWRSSTYFSFSLYPNKTFSFISTTYFQPALSNFSDYRVSSTNSMYFLISKKLSFKSSFVYNFDAAPVLGIPKTQFNLNSGIVYAF